MARAAAAAHSEAEGSATIKYLPWAAGLALVLFPMVVTYLNGTMFAPDCELRTFLGLVASHTTRAELTCQSLPLALDLPSLAIGASSALSIPLYYAMRRHLLTLDRRMRESGLISRKNTRQIVDFSVPFPAGTNALWGAVAVCVAMAGVTVYFYFYVADHAAWAGLVRHYMGSADEPLPQASWWASSEYPASQVAWMAVGWVGACFAILHARLNYLLVRRLRRADTPRTRYLIKNSDGQHGWADFDRVFTLSLFGTANFLLAIFPVLYLLMGHDATRVGALLGGVALLGGGLACATLILQFRAFVNASYGRAWEKRARQLERLIDRGGEASIGARVDRDEMGAPGEFPLSGPWKKVLQLWGGATVAVFVSVVISTFIWIARAFVQ